LPLAEHPPGVPNGVNLLSFLFRDTLETR